MKTNRRDFLKAGALAGTSLALSPLAGSAAERKSQYKLPYKKYLCKEFICCRK